MKQEDVDPLERWRNRFRIPIIVFQVFMDELHFAPLDTILREGKLREDRTTKKLTYWYPIMREKSRLADIEDIEVEARLEFDEKGRLVVFPVIGGGRFTNVNEDAIRCLGEMLKIGDRSVQGSA